MRMYIEMEPGRSMHAGAHHVHGQQRPDPVPAGPAPSSMASSQPRSASLSPTTSFSERRHVSGAPANLLNGAVYDFAHELHTFMHACVTDRQYV